MTKNMRRIQSMDELLGLEEEEAQEKAERTELSPAKNGIEYLPPTAIRMFQNHPFHLYEGDRLKELVDSIAENGVLVPVIVRKIEPDADGYRYEMLAGHNRRQGAIQAGLDKIPCIVKENLSDKEAWVYVIETNVIQRSFSELYPSEKAAVLSMRYSRVISQGKRNDIIAEIKRLEGEVMQEEGTCGNDFHKLKSREALGAEYDLTGRMVANYLRIHELIPALKLRIDEGEITLACGVTLSYLIDKDQETVEQVLKDEKCKMTPQNASELRKKGGSLDEETVRQILCSSKKPSVEKRVTYRIKPDIYQKYFSEQTSQKEFEQIVDQALALYFANRQTVN